MKSRSLLSMVAGGLAAIPLLSELRVRRAARPPRQSWRTLRVEPRGDTLLGISFRPLQAQALGLDAREALSTLLAQPFDLIRLPAYWNRMEPSAGRFETDELDWQVDSAQRSAKKILLAVGTVKGYGYPEFFVPDHHLPKPLPEGRLVRPEDHEALLAASTAFITRVIDRYRQRSSVIGWQIEHEAVDPLGFEHSWRLSEPFVRKEVEAARSADPSRPIVMNGFLPTSLPVRLQQWWRTRDQGDSLEVAQNMADILGIDFYPRHGLVRFGPFTAYLDGSRAPWQHRTRKKLFTWASGSGRSLMVAEGQAEPWETVTTPPSPPSHVMFSCRPEDVVGNYNQCLRWSHSGPPHLYAYLFWGAEYWLLRAAQGDSSYLEAFERVLEES